MQCCGRIARRVPDWDCHDAQVLELIATRLALEDRMDLNMFLDMLGSHIGTFLLCGRFCLSWRFPFIWTWTKMPLQAREQAMLSWATSRFSQFRKVRRCPTKCSCELLYCSEILNMDVHTCAVNTYWPCRGSRP